MIAKNRSPHCDWTNTDLESLSTADFPIYVWEQRVGDLVVFPPATAHQVWNMGKSSTKVVWNIMPPIAAKVAIDYVLPAYNRACHTDIAHARPAIAHAVIKMSQSGDSSNMSPQDLLMLQQLFIELLEEDRIDGVPATEIKSINVNEEIIKCDFCGTAIWNRYLCCNECGDFEICMQCYVNGRSCSHVTQYQWVEQYSSRFCENLATEFAIVLRLPNSSVHNV